MEVLPQGLKAQRTAVLYQLAIVLILTEMRNDLIGLLLDELIYLLQGVDFCIIG
jgi:hypothetical protein